MTTTTTQTPPATPATPPATPPAGTPPGTPPATPPGTPPGDVAGSAPADTATPDGATAPGAGEGDGGAPPATGAPAEYAAFQLPDGYVLEGERLELLKTLGKQNNWTQEQAQAMVDKHIELSAEGMTMARNAKVESWHAASEKEFGANFAPIVTDAQAAIAWAAKDRPTLLQTFEDEGWGSNPDALWMLAQLGRMVRETPIQGLGNDTASGGAIEPKPAAAVLYPNEAKRT